SSELGSDVEKYQLKEISDPTGTWNYGLKIDHNENMEPETVYVNVTAVDEKGHNDTSGPLTINIESAPPYVIETIPTDGEVSIDPFSNIEIVFSDVMDDETIPNISHLQGDVPEYLEFKGWNETFQRSDTAVWTHNGWDNDENISLVVSNYYDEYGVKGEEYTWNFTTKWSPNIVYIGHSNITESSVKLEMNFTSGDYDTIFVRFKYRKSGESEWLDTEQKQFSGNRTYSTMVSSLGSNTSYEYLGYIEFQGRNITSVIGNFTTEPLDTDDDGVPDSEDDDDDGDGMPDEWEEKYGFDPKDSTDAEEDFDQDGLTNLEEYNKGTYPDNPDSDGDGVYDKEDKYPMDPSKSSDFPWLKIIAWIVISLVITAIGVIIFLLIRRARPSEDEEELEEDEEVGEDEDSEDDDIGEEDIDELIDQL
ncbi:MAG: Ig-like domain-containing protein, partial [Thermoplasmatota archaeon]